eukprot:TRINITY_DN779852_c0_g1_i1.p1 TRINITY_DN779852_c0_g1~~TRINITY_DN779852_c0_g1_i1.p1  ORF type:complete len:154 (+),score=22.60 TRINITY_DN779852_c0_g1_i1:68-529(+)
MNSLFGGDGDHTSLLSTPKVSAKQRLYGFVICLGLGILFTTMGLMSFTSPGKFATFFILGNVCAFGSLFFLVGPKKFTKSMFKKKRRVAGGVYLISLFVALYAAFGMDSAIMCILACIIEYSAFFWYALSYIPFGRKVVGKFFGSVFKCCIRS